MNAGKLTEIIEVWKPEITRDEYGNQRTTYRLAYSTRAFVSHKSGGREVANDEIVYIYSKTFKVRLYHQISDFDRIKWNGKFYKIMEIEPNKEFQELTIETEQIDE